MSISEILEKVQFVTDDEGNEAVLIDLATWEELLTLVRVAHPDSDHLSSVDEDEARWNELFTQHPEVLERLAKEAIAEYEAGKTQELDPDKL